MKKNLLDLDLQLFAEEAEDAGANEVETTAESQEEASEGEEAETGANEEPGTAEPEQTPEENARYAAIRRRAEEEAKRKYDAQQAAMNQQIAAMCQGVTHPVTNQPIRTVQEYVEALSIQQKMAREQELQEKGVDPALIDQMVASNPAVLQAQMYMAQMQEQENLAKVQRDIEEISKLDPNVKTAEDLYNAPYLNDLIAYCQQHNTTLTDAYKILQFNNLLSNNNDAARQQAINQMRGKSHLPSQSQSVATDDDYVEVPAEIMTRMKEEGKTEKQIRELYRKVANKLNIS